MSQNKTALVSYKYAGLYNSTLTVTDSAPSWVGGPFTASSTFLINVTGTPTVFSLGVSPNATVAFVGHAVQFTATVAYNNNYPPILRSTGFRYVFFFGDGTSQTISSGASASVSHTYSSNAKFNVLVQAQETRTTPFSKSRIQENGYTIMTVDAPITSDFSYSPSTFQSGQTVTFTANASGGTSTFTYSWAFGDGTTGTGSTTTHTYSSAGTYNVNLTITDSYGGTVIVTRSVTVTSPSATLPAPPFPLIYVAGLGIGGAAIVAALVLLSRRRRKGVLSPI
jgi:PKD repeat protein